VIGRHELIGSVLTDGLGSFFEGWIRVGDGPEMPDVQHFAKLPEPPDFMRGFERAVIFAQELLVPVIRQRAKDLRRIIRRPMQRLSSHSLRLPRGRLGLPSFAHSLGHWAGRGKVGPLRGALGGRLRGSVMTWGWPE